MTGGHCPKPLASPECLLQRFLVDAPLAKRSLYWRVKRQGLAVPRATITGDGGATRGYPRSRCRSRSTANAMCGCSGGRRGRRPF